MVRAISQFSEELANSITHGFGLVLSVIGLGAMVTLACLHGNAWHIVSCSVYGVSLVLLYAASTTYHSVRKTRLKEIFKILDHAAIYLLIAGTYTPFLLVTMRGRWGWTLFAIVWALAVAGIVFKIFFVNRFQILATLLYLMMGWLVVVAAKEVIAAIPLSALALLIAGGLTYSVGTIFFMNNRIPYNHTIWHVFVLAGSIFHFFAVLLYVIPSA